MAGACDLSTLTPAAQMALADALYVRARRLVRVGQNAKARPIVDEVLAIDERLVADSDGAQRQWLAIHLVSAVGVAFELGDYRSAHDFSRRAIEQHSECSSGDPAGSSDAWWGLAKLVFAAAFTTVSIDELFGAPPDLRERWAEAGDIRVGYLVSESRLEDAKVAIQEIDDLARPWQR